MNEAMPQMNEAESKFFESRGQDVAPLLNQETSEPDTPADDAAAGKPDDERAEAHIAPAKPERDERFVPLKALQEERAEKKQLREELKAYREWQAQLAQRLQQFPSQPQAPDPKTQPLEYINHVLGNVQNSTAELQQWRQQQEQAAQQRAQLERADAWMAGHEEEFAKAQPEYKDAYRFAEDARDQELKAIGYADPAQRAAILRANRLEIMSNAVQQGRNPAELVWEYARARGFAARRERPDMGSSHGDDRVGMEPALDWARSRTAQRPGGASDAQSKIAAGMRVAGAKLNQGGEAGEGELNARDLAGITDPEEFEKAWKRVFGKRRQ